MFTLILCDFGSTYPDLPPVINTDNGSAMLEETLENI
jgi:hypothetical protein